MIARSQTTIITDAVAELYDEAKVLRPTAKHCIAPLGELVGAFNLICTELAALTSRAAMNYLLRRGGLLEPIDAASNESLAGFLYTSPRFGSIFVEQNDPVVRRRFSVAHELGHYLLHFRPLLESLEVGDDVFLIEAINSGTGKESIEAEQAESDELSDELPTGRVSVGGESHSAYELLDQDQMEREANQFAVELLMPAETVCELANQYSVLLDGKDLTRRLADEILVSREAMRWRLRSLGYRGC